MEIIGESCRKERTAHLVDRSLAHCPVQRRANNKNKVSKWTAWAKHRNLAVEHLPQASKNNRQNRFPTSFSAIASGAVNVNNTFFGHTKHFSSSVHLSLSAQVSRPNAFTGVCVCVFLFCSPPYCSIVLYELVDGRVLLLLL